ncbi:MAG: hypothetical protein E5Y70_28485 [Mesorhizobium sp.]|nr:MAG: hypothetical protein EOR83_31735 [Mesorhizobium sp.]TIL70974.1 MAG: hypothetical protein E5Y70_28485 [Mesorhizobium sp.]
MTSTRMPVSLAAASREPSPRMGAWREELDRLLSANAAKPRRERLTLIRIFEEHHHHQSWPGEWRLRRDKDGHRAA